MRNDIYYEDINIQKTLNILVSLESFYKYNAPNRLRKNINTYEKPESANCLHYEKLNITMEPDMTKKHNAKQSELQFTLFGIKSQIQIRFLQ